MDVICASSLMKIRKKLSQFDEMMNYSHTGVFHNRWSPTTSTTCTSKMKNRYSDLQIQILNSMSLQILLQLKVLKTMLKSFTHLKPMSISCKNQNKWKLLQIKHNLPHGHNCPPLPRRRKKRHLFQS